MDLAWAVEKTGEVIHLEVGQPDFATPEPIVEATCRYARAGHTKYVPNAGVDALRAAAARHFERCTGVPTTSANILVTPGAVMSVATAFLALLEPGDEVLLPDPGWPNYEMAVSIVHGQPVFYNLRAENHFLPDLDEIDRLVSPRTKAPPPLHALQSHWPSVRRDVNAPAHGLGPAPQLVGAVRRDLRSDRLRPTRIRARCRTTPTDAPSSSPACPKATP